MKIIIESQPDGTFLVSEEAEAAVLPPDAAAESPSPFAPAAGQNPAQAEAVPGEGGQTAQNIDEALSIARGLLTGQAQGGDAEAMFTSGFDSARAGVQ